MGRTLDVNNITIEDATNGKVAPVPNIPGDLSWKPEVATGETMTLRHLVWRLREEFYPERHPYDELTGCDTSGMIHRRRLAAESEDYQPVDPDIFRACLAHIREELSRFTFVDIGCGKGRALLLAEEYDFREIIGVEFSRSSRKSLRQMPRKSDRSASRWFARMLAASDFPPGLWSSSCSIPSAAEILRCRRAQRLSQHTNDLYVVYINPLYGD